MSNNFSLFKNKKTLVVLILSVNILVSCSETLHSEKQMIEMALSSNHFGEIEVYKRSENHEIPYNIKNVHFLSGKELLAKRSTDFYSVNTSKKGDSVTVYVNHYKTGKQFVFIFKQKNKGDWKLVSQEWGLVKFTGNAPYYIYLENMRWIDPEWKNYPIEAIPRDSLF